MEGEGLSGSTTPTRLLMFSRAGKSTNSQYLAFQDKNKHRYIQSRVFSGPGMELQQNKSNRHSKDIEIENALNSIINKTNKIDKMDLGENYSQRTKASIIQEMNKIERENQLRMMSDARKLKRQVGLSDQDISIQLFKEKQKNFTSNFQSCSRDRYQQITSSKTNAPAVGHYNPRKELVLNSIR